jgi:UDP-N-acetylmuramoyl-L-alanyl-D-glutamate--2,6-diaminopimelate ligase
VLTNIKSGDLAEHNTSRAYQRIKSRIFRMLKPCGLAVVNADDHRCRNIMSELRGPCLTYAVHADGDLTATVLECFSSEQTFLLSAGNDSISVRTRMIGDHHVSNCLAAAAVGLGLGIELETIARGLEAVERVPGRLERLECGQPFGVFVDAAATPETLALAMKTVRQVTRGRVLVVFGSRTSDEPSRRALIGRVLERGAHFPILTGGYTNNREPLQLAHEILDGFERPHKAQIIPRRSEAIHSALSQAKAGDAVLITGCDPCANPPANGHQLVQDDREIACRWLYSQNMQGGSLPRLRVVG